MRKIGSGDCSIEVDSVDENVWNELLNPFSDANVYQTWAYEACRSPRGSVSHLVLRRAGVVIAAAQARIVKLPLAPIGVAYVRWGPMWRRRNEQADPGVLALALQALRQEYVQRRGLLIRVLPYAFDEEQDTVAPILSGELFQRVNSEAAQRTLVMSIDRPLADLRKGLDQKWRNCLNRAERNGINVEHRCDDEAFASFSGIYRDMHARKRFAGATDVDHFRRVQQSLPDDLKLQIFIARHDGRLAAGLVVSGIGDTGVFLLGGTTDAGMECKASYILQWRALEWLHGSGKKFYNLHGINPTTNPGTYHFKAGLTGKNGRDVHYLGVHDCVDGAGMARIVRWAGEARWILKRNPTLPKSSRVGHP